MVRCGTERQRDRSGRERGYRCGGERETGVREKERDRGGREKDKKRFRVGERKIGRETGVVEREREREIKRKTGAGEKEKEKAAESEPQIERKRDRDGRQKEERETTVGDK